MKLYQVKAARELAQEQTEMASDMSVGGLQVSTSCCCLHEEFFQLLGGGLIQLFCEEKNSKKLQK